MTKKINSDRAEVNMVECKPFVKYKSEFNQQIGYREGTNDQLISL